MNKPRTFLPVCFSDRIPSVLFFALLSIATVFALYCLQSCGDSSLSPQSQPPIVTDIPDQTIREGELFATISLDNYVDDPDDADSEITWTFRGSDSLTVSVDEARVATINPPSLEWNGCDTLIFTAADPSGNRASSSGVFTVTGVNDAPIVQYIPNQYAYETFAFEPIALEDCVLDYDNTDAEIVWTCTGNIDLDVSIISYLFAVVSVPYPGWTGQETITLRATDPAGLSDERSATFTVIPVTHDPLVRDDWPVSTPEEQGVSGDLVHDTYLEAMHLEGLYSLLVIKNGYLVAERYFNDAYVDMAPSVASVTKSFTSALTGLALRDGHLTSLDQKMVDFFPELDWAGTDLRKGDITIRQMLQMRSGYPAEAVGGYLDELMAYDFDWIPVLIDFP
ncbi:MAG: serine hydrolase, partial [Candidatus Zixiibacteriota bacterium]